MPTIEIVSIDSDVDIDQKDFEVAILVDKKMESHRGLFFDFLIKQNGTMIHVGNPEFKNDKDGGFFAGAIIDWGLETSDLAIPQVDPNDPTDNWGANQSFRYRFSKEYKSDIDQLIKTAIRESRIKKAYFLTDYQFGPEKPSHEIIYTLTDLWDRHDNEGLEWNKLYEIYSV
jgi:hypothetical protein